MSIHSLRITCLVTLASLLMATPALAGPENFQRGQTIPEYGKIIAVKVDQQVYRHHKFKVAFDVDKQAKAGELNRNLVSAARFINMHTAAGIKAKNIKLAIVVHGTATKDMTRAEYYAAAQDGDDKKPNANADLIKILSEHGVEFFVCGQSAAYYDVKNEDLLPDVKMALSAMTAHALLQQKDYTLNPF
ncbi:MAG: DsrE family protein [Robiginitomaculum sp.]|nr:DsrE family protein [Robiginitomaculum sp.]